VADRTWKAFERRMARMFGTERIPAAGVMGKQQKDAADFETPLFAAQVKKGYKQPSYLREWLQGIVGACGSKLPVVIWSENRGKDDDALVFLRARDFALLVALADANAPASSEP
jgi:hypothetical protein